MSIQTQIDRIAAAKTAIKTAIENKGVAVPNTTKLDGFAPLIANITSGISLKIVDSVEEMTDTTKQYVLSSDGHIYEYKTTQTTGTVTEQIGYAEGDANTDNTRLGSDGTTHTSTSYAGYVVTPFIDLLKYPVPFTLHLNGGTFIPTASDSYTRIASYTADKAKITCVNTVSSVINSVLNVSNSDVSASAGNAGSITFNQTPKTNNANNDGVLKYVRFSGKSTIADINVYVTYTGTTTTQGWTDTGVAYGGDTTQLVNKVASMNNEGADATAFQLLPPVVLEYYNKPAYSDSDYSTTHIVNYGHDATRPYRGDIPQPVMIKWPHNENAVRTTVTVDGQTLDATGRDRLPVYNLIPATQYAYKVTHILADGTIVTAKSGSFTTAAQTVRLLYVDGCQNFRDLGGWSAENGKKVKYGQLIRGAAVDESTYPHLLITDKGRHELIDHIGVKAECDLRWQMTESGISKDLPFLCSGGIGNYALTINQSDLRAAVKTNFEWILARLQESKPVYFHCQGGCDRTGTLSFLLLGVLGVSESDLARDYELSCFSPLGTGRVRNATVYNYSGMVSAVKAYSGATLQAKITDYLTTGCAISAESITAFKNLMLE